MVIHSWGRFILMRLVVSQWFVAKQIQLWFRQLNSELSDTSTLTFHSLVTDLQYFIRNVCLFAWLWGSRLSLDVISNITAWPLELYYSWDQCQDLNRARYRGTTSLHRGFYFFTLTFLRHISLRDPLPPQHFFFLLRLSYEHEKWECTPPGMTAWERH